MLTVVRMPYFVVVSNLENYCYGLLLQYVQHRDENELVVNYDPVSGAFFAREFHFERLIHDWSFMGKKTENVFRFMLSK